MKQQLGCTVQGKKEQEQPCQKIKSTTIARQGGQEASNQTKPIKLD